MRLQGKSGMWHQLLTHPDSYEETSCTSMFVYGLCRGLRFGWLAENQRGDALEAVRRGWHGIISRSVDRGGNVYGICRGSSYSFTPEYYKEELLWIVNDPHGIGIVHLHNYPTYNKILIIRKQLQKRSCGADEDKGSTFSFT